MLVCIYGITSTCNMMTFVYFVSELVTGIKLNHYVSVDVDSLYCNKENIYVHMNIIVKENTNQFFFILLQNFLNISRWKLQGHIINVRLNLHTRTKAMKYVIYNCTLIAGSFNTLLWTMLNFRPEGLTILTPYRGSLGSSHFLS